MPVVNFTPRYKVAVQVSVTVQSAVGPKVPQLTKLKLASENYSRQYSEQPMWLLW